MTQQSHLAHITHRLRQQQLQMAPSAEMKRRFLAKVFHAQLRSEKEAISSHIGGLQPGVHPLDQLGHVS